MKHNISALAIIAAFGVFSTALYIAAAIATDPLPLMSPLQHGRADYLLGAANMSAIQLALFVVMTIGGWKTAPVVSK